MRIQRILFILVGATMLASVFSCGGSATSPGVTGSDVAVTISANSQTWPMGLPVDAPQPWEELDADGKVVAGLSANSEFLCGVERHLDRGTDITEAGEALNIASGDCGSGAVNWAMYRVVMGNEQPGVTCADVNLAEKSDGNLSGYYIGLSNYGQGRWDWYGPFSDNHVRISTGADVKSGADYLSDLGNLFVCVVAHDGAVFDVVGIAAEAAFGIDTEAPPVPTGLFAVPVYGGLDLQWNGVVAGDLAGYRVYYGDADFTAVDEAGVQCLYYLIGQDTYLLAGLTTETYVRVSAVDLDGNESALCDSASQIPLGGNGPALRLGTDSANGLIHDAISLSASGADNYNWDLDGDGVYEVTGDTTGTQAADTTRTGIIRPSVRGTTEDGSCLATAAVSLIVTANSRPLANAYADPSAGDAPLLTTLTGSGIDDDGTIVSYSWDFDGDGTFDQTDATDPGPVAHTYTAAGFYNAKFRVEDNEGSWDIDTVGVLVNPAPVPANTAPTAQLTIGTGEESGDAPHSVHFDASGSSDPDAGDSIVRYWWDLDGDGGYEVVTPGATYNYTYPNPGVFTAAVIVEDTHLETGSDTVTITVNIAGNDLPVADLTSDVQNGDFPLTVDFDAQGSTDSDGSVVRYDYDFDGDGNYEIYDGDDSPDWEYTEPGIFNATVRVTDDDGAQDTAEVAITVNVPGNDTPTADVNASPTSGDVPLTVSFDASGSSDSDGSIVRYDWDFDEDGNYEIYDGGDTPDWTYTTAGVYDAKLRVTDDDGAQATDTASIDINDPPVAVLYIYPDEIEAGEAAWLHAEDSSDSDGSIADYEWDLDGDGTYNETGAEADNQGDPTIEYSFDQSGVYEVAVRVTDDDGCRATDSVNLTVHGWRCQGVHTSGQVGTYPSIAIVEGHPAISYRYQGSGDLYYRRAGDPYGVQWGNHVTVTTDNASYNCMIVVDGKPAVCYYDATNDALKYCRANDATGSSWGSSMMVDSSGAVGLHCSMCIVDGNPAISYHDSLPNFDLKYVRASDATGSTWGTPMTIASTANSGMFSSMVVADGNPAVAYYEVGVNDLMFIRAGDSTGSTWNSPITLDSTDDCGRYLSMAIVDGYPAVSYIAESTGANLRYIQATSADGSTWASPESVVGGELGSLTNSALVVVDGCPVISFYGGASEDLYYVPATDSSGGSWGTVQTVDSNGNVGEYATMTVAAGMPAIAYFKFDNWNLKYARLF